MSNYLLKYKGTYRILCEIDRETNDFPRNSKGEIEDNDLYIVCAYGNRIYNYGHGTLIAYIPSVKRGHKILNILNETKISLSDIQESDEEVEFKFKACDIETIATLLKARTLGASISPFSTKNLPKSDVTIPTEKMEEYKKITAQVDKKDILTISHLIKTFMEDILSKNLKKKYKNKEFDYKLHMRKVCMSRQPKEYIYTQNLWSEFIDYLNENLIK